MIEVTDAIDRQVRLERPARRIVSLVPSETLSVIELGGIERVVGRTDYCTEPQEALDALPSVGGTKGFDVDAVMALEPDLILANKEENSRPLVRALMASGVAVHVSFPQTVDQSLEYLDSLCALLGVDAAESELVRACRRAVKDARQLVPETLLPVFVPIWKDPWMTFDGRVYASDVLSLCGATNVFAGRERRYPLAADLGKSEGWSEEKVDLRDTRYPRIQLEEVVARGARAAMLPDEPYPFGTDDADALADLAAEKPLVAELVDGKSLFWYGTFLARGVDSLRERVAELRARCVGSSPNK